MWGESRGPIVAVSVRGVARTKDWTRGVDDAPDRAADVARGLLRRVPMQVVVTYAGGTVWGALTDVSDQGALWIAENGSGASFRIPAAEVTSLKRP